MSVRYLGASVMMAGLALGQPLEMELDRQTPVAANSSIPITDFFRPVYMSSPKISPGGTHVAALVSGNSDKLSLMVIDLDKKARDIVQGRSGNIVYSHRWLGDEHIAFRLSMDKHFDLGLMVARITKLNNAYPVFQYGFSSIIGVPRDNPIEPFVWVRGAGPQRFSGVYRLNAG